MALSNREYIGRALEILSAGLEPHIRRVFGEVAPGLDWPEILAAKDAAAGHGKKEYKATDLQLQLRALTERLGNLGYPFALPPVAGAYASELRQVRNLWAHNEPFTDDDVARYLGTVSRLLRWIVADKHAEQVDELVREFKTSPAQVPQPPAPLEPQQPAAVPVPGPAAQDDLPPAERDESTRSEPAESNDGTSRDVPTVSIALEAASELSYAMSYNGSQIVSRVVITNNGPEIRGARLLMTVTGLGGTLSRVSEHFLDVPEKATVTLVDPELGADPAAMLQLEDRQAGEIRAELRQGEEIVAERTTGIELVGAQHWMLRSGLLAMESLAAFVQPNHPEIAKLCSEASDLLLKSTGSGSLQGYQSGSERADAIAHALFTAMNNRDIRYSEPAPAWGQHAQRIRTPAEVLVGRFGTCMDTTVVLAAALEFAGLQPNLWLMDGHIFLGYWREEFNFQIPALEDVQQLVNAIDLEHIRLIETTRVTAQSTPTPQELHDAAYVPYLTGEMESVRGFIDIYAARNSGIRPIPARIVEPSGEVGVFEYVPQRREVAPASKRNREATQGAKPAGLQIPARIGQWKNALLDLSLRNRLINFTETARFPLAVPDSRIGEFEDLVSNGTAVYLQPSDQVSAMQRESGIRYGRDLPQDQLEKLLVERHSVFANVTEAAYQSRMRNLAYKARTLVEETGANNLYLAMGSLVWNIDGKDLRSPLVLVPVNLRPTSKSGPYQVSLDVSGASTPNYCLIEKLRLEHGLSIPGLTEPEEDEHGIDLEAAFSAVRTAIQSKGLPFRVEPTVDLSILQFAKFRLWKDLDENWEELSRNPLVRHLVHTPTEAFSDPVTWDTKVNLDELAARVPIPADSTQLQAISEAMAGKTFVLEGPPGTGKSQTITNLLTRAVADGKRVLFVAEKRAALEVVQKRLASVGMDVFALDLHDKGSKPAAVQQQIRRALEHRVEPDRQGLDAAVSELHRARRGLVRYASKLHEDNDAELSLYSARTQELAVGAGIAPLEIPDSFAETTNMEQLQQLRTVLGELPESADPADPGDRTPWGFIDVPVSKGNQAAIAEASRAFQAAWEVASKDPDLARLLESARTPTDLQKAADLLAAGKLELEVLDEVSTHRWESAVQDLSAQMTAFLAVSHPGLDHVTPGAMDLPLADIHAQAVAAAESGFFGRKKRLITVRDQLAGVLRPGTELKPKEVPGLTEALVAVQGAIRGLAQGAGALPGIQLPTSWNPLTEEGQRQLRGNVQWLKWAAGLIKPTRDAAPDSFLGILRKFLNTRKMLSPQAVQAVGVMARASSDLFAKAEVLEQDLAAWAGQRTLVERWNHTSRGRDVEREGLPSLRRWSRFIDQLEPLRAAGLHAARNQLRSGAIPADDAVTAFERGFALAAQRERAAATGLDQFEPRSHEKHIERFLARSASIREQLKEAIPAEVLAQREFDPTSGAGQMGTLQRQLTRKRGLKVRTLLENYTDLITRITPCVLVSPDSVARFFPAKSALFDLVVFDEASQIRVADAVGAMGRGRAVVVVGDSKQMPPTSFAETGLDKDDDGGLTADIVADEESILSECVLARVPRHWLSWHYRSQDESLIAFSNQQYYESRLSSFPAPVHGVPNASPDGHGVNFVRVEGRFHRTGKGTLLRTNPVEAQAVVAEIHRRFLASPREFPSLGVVTFNLQQRAYIEALLRDSDDPRILAALDAADGLFVKNLENVQGDERDTILFSTGFSKNDQGYLPLNFGPLNRSGGERRLNVAVTRARRQVIVFSSFDPKDLRAEETSSVGIKHLRSYLDLAAGGTDALAFDTRRKPAVDRHREQIAGALRERGLVVATDVGLSDFKVDLSVALPEDPERPLMAILLDTPVWAARGTVGDRDGLPSDVLARMLRWPSVQRVWLPEWLTDSTAVLDRLEKEIRREDLLAEPEELPVLEPEPAASETQSVPPAAETRDLSPVLATPPAPVHTNATPYLPWSYRGLGGIEYLNDLKSSARARATVRGVLEMVVEAEGPVHSVRLAKLVCAEFSLNKVNGQRAGSVLKLLDRNKFYVDSDAFVWPSHLDPAAWDGYRENDEFVERKIEHVCLEELGNAMVDLCRDAAGLEPEDLKRQTVRVFGGKRVTEGIGARLEEAIRAAVVAGKLEEGMGLLIALRSHD